MSDIAWLAILFKIPLGVVGHSDRPKHCRQGAGGRFAGAGRSSDIQKLNDLRSDKCVAKVGRQHISDAFDE